MIGLATEGLILSYVFCVPSHAYFKLVGARWSSLAQPSSGTIRDLHRADMARMRKSPCRCRPDQGLRERLLCNWVLAAAGGSGQPTLHVIQLVKTLMYIPLAHTRLRSGTAVAVHAPAPATNACLRGRARARHTPQGDSPRATCGVPGQLRAFILDTTFVILCAGLRAPARAAPSPAQEMTSPTDEASGRPIRPRARGGCRLEMAHKGRPGCRRRSAAGLAGRDAASALGRRGGYCCAGGCCCCCCC